MHIGFDVSQTGRGKAGCGYFAHAMVQSLLGLAPGNRYALYPSFGDFYFDPATSLRRRYGGADVQFGPRHLARASACSFWNSDQLEAHLGHPEIIQSNNFWCPVQLRATRLVYTLYDMGFAVEPDWTTEANRIGCFDGVFRSAVAADWIMAISEASKEHYLRMFPAFPRDRIRVIHPCSRFTDTRRLGRRPKALKGIAEEAFWLSVGTIEPRKNQRRLVEAYAAYVAANDDAMPLVLAGGKGWLMDDFRSLLVGLGVSDRVVLTGYVSDDELIWLYRNCYANLYPSLFEGFGLPVLEGMQFGAATVCSNATSLPEVAGRAAIQISPHDTEGWAAAMCELATQRARRDDLRRTAMARAGEFDWTGSARQLLGLYEEAAASPKRTGGTR